MSEFAIKVENVSKLYKLYDRPVDRMVESLGLTRKKLYKEHYALHDVSFGVERGGVVGIIGTNGSGKSTILKIITGVLNPTGGNIVINGRISALLELGAGFNMEYTGIENIYLNGTMIGFSRNEIDAKIQEILDFADIGDFVYQPVKTYSSGMFVRLAFAIAINIEPEILIVDEALSVGDVFFQAKCYKKFEEFKKLGKTILIVSHDLSSISKYCDKVVLLNQGKKVAEGNPKQMIDLYKKVLVGQTEATTLANRDEKNENIDASKSFWKEHYESNPNCQEYGDGKVEIIDYAIVDNQGIYTNNIMKGTIFQIKMKLQFKEVVPEPIAAFTITNLKGTEITGTNTMYEKMDIPVENTGEIFEICFEQNMNLQGGNYLISLGCTGYQNGEFQVYHRLYDVCNLTVVSSKDTVGFYDMDSEVSIDKEGQAI